MGTQTSLRYALNLIAPSDLLAKRRKSSVIDVADVRLAYTYFCDVDRSIKYAQETMGMMFGEEIGSVMGGSVNGVQGMEIDVAA